jgi:hypothetical protein
MNLKFLHILSIKTGIDMNSAKAALLLASFVIALKAGSCQNVGAFR